LKVLTTDGAALGRARVISALAGAALALAGYAWQVETRRLRITRLTIRLPGLPPAFEGYRIAHLSDLHLGVRMNYARLPLIVAAVQRERPDLIVLTGDFATGTRDGLTEGPALLSALRALDGVWAVLGNHDHVAGANRVTTMLDAAGIGLLHNTSHTLRRGDDTLVLAGVDDAVQGAPDLRAALEGAPPDQPAILLAHTPDFAPRAAADPRVALQLSGHSHGGQVCLPGGRPLVLPRGGKAYPAGLYAIGDLQLFVTVGTGTSWLVARLNCRPEFAMITLAADPAQQKIV